MIKFNVRDFFNMHLKGGNSSTASSVSKNSKGDASNKEIVAKFNVQESLMASLNKPTVNVNDTRLYKKIDDFNLSVRSRNCLKNVNIIYLGELIQKSEENLMHIPGFGYTCLCEIKKLVQSLDLSLGSIVLGWVSPCVEGLQEQDGDNAIRIQATDARLLKQVDELELSVRGYNCLNNAKINWLGELVQKTEAELLKTPNFGRKSLNEIKIQLGELGLSLGMRVIGWPPENLAELVAQQLLGADVSLEDCIKEIENYVESQFTDIEKSVYYQRISQIHGATLQALTEGSGVTRERIRQIEINATNKLLRIFNKNISSINRIFTEFGSIIDYATNEHHNDIRLIRAHSALLHNLLGADGRYAIDLKKQWLYKVADLPEFVISNLDSDSMDGLVEHISQNLSHIIRNDTPDTKRNFTSILNRYIKQVIVDNFIFIDGKRTENNKNAVFHRFLSQVQHSVAPMNLADLFKEYAAFLTQNNLDSNRYGYSYTSFSNMVIERKDVLLSLGHKVRYYNYNNFNIKRLIKRLNLDDYKNLEISCKKIFDENVELMSDYNILNAHELHNFLKKHYQDKTAVFLRMPIVRFGRANREKQVYKFARPIAPIKLTDLAVAYEEAFGIAQSSFMANYIQCLRDYTYRGMVVFDNAKSISERERGLILSVLTKDFYFIHEVEKLFRGVFAEKYNKYMHQSVLKSLGFYMAPQYILSDKYASLREYINNKFDNMPIIDMEFYKEYRSLSAFENWFHSKRNSSNLIKFSDSKYISSDALVKAGITKDTIKEYIKQVLTCAQNKFFTIYSLSESSCHFDLEDFGFEDVFYEDVIMKYANIAFTKINNVAVFKNTSDSISFSSFISSLMEHFRIINIYDLVDKLKEDYGLIVNRYDIIRLTDETDLYYNDITENVYITYDEFITSF